MWYLNFFLCNANRAKVQLNDGIYKLNITFAANFKLCPLTYKRYAIMKAFWTILLLISSNVFMTFAWYGHLKLQQMKISTS